MRGGGGDVVWLWVWKEDYVGGGVGGDGGGRGMDLGEIEEAGGGWRGGVGFGGLDLFQSLACLGFLPLLLLNLIDARTDE